MPRKIIHIDLDAFFCAVEALQNPSLVRKPYAVGGKPNERGVISSSSYSARCFGIRSAMPTALALQKCPELLVIKPNFQAYEEYSQLVMEFLKDITPLMEQVSIDEAFIDVSELPDSGEEIAKKIQFHINTDLKLPCSFGIASNKLVAKIANDVGKAAAKGQNPPNAITIVPVGKETEFLAPLPVEQLWGVGKKTAERLSALGINNIGELATYPDTELKRLLGKTGFDLSRRAKGIDDQPILLNHVRKSISQERTFAKDIDDEQCLLRTLFSLSETVSRQLRMKQLTGRTIRLKLRWPDFTTLTRQMTLTNPTDQSSRIYEVASLLFEKIWIKGNAVRLIGVGINNLESPSHQLTLWKDTQSQLQSAVDNLKERFGEHVIVHGSDVVHRNDITD